MSRKIRIELSEVPTASTIHRFRNFGEGLSELLGDAGSVDGREVDSATTSLTVRNIKGRNVRRVAKILERELKKHNFLEFTTLVDENEEG